MQSQPTTTLTPDTNTQNAVEDQSTIPTKIIETIQRIWGFSTLLPLQAEAINAGLQQRDSLVVLPTGGGKSLCYQVPPLVTERLDIVVSPLISLMKDQVDGLQANGYPAAAIYSGLSDAERRDIAHQVQTGDIRLLFVAPERLFNSRFLDFIESAGVSSFAIDEAHCISHWGHDFRPEYRRLVELRQRFPNASFHAFTATATERVRQDIVDQLELKNPSLLVGYFDRPNLVYRMVPRIDIHQQVLDAVLRHEREAVIIYCISRKETEGIAAFLKMKNVNAEAYHAGMTPNDRRRIQDAFAHERLDVVVATVAFGMGIDRSNVRCVIHASMPKSVEHYQQETGRAGRDSLEAECVLFYSQGDVIRWERLIEQSAEEADRPEEVTTAANKLLKEMQKLASGVICRHRTLIEYFGQTYDKTNCEACDVCMDELDVIPESTTIAKKIISCVARVQQRFGVGHIADVLTGSKAELVRRCNHDELSVHGLLSDMTKKEVMNLTHQLIDQNCLARTDGDRPVVTLSDRSSEVLRDEIEVQLVKPPESTKQAKFDSESWEGVDRALFEVLRGIRREIADEREVPASVIFSDATLRDLARQRPTSTETMQNVYGIGEKKIVEFGQPIIETIVDYCTEYDVTTNVQTNTARKSSRIPLGDKPIQPWKQAIFDQFRNGASIEEVMRVSTRAYSTVANYLTEYIAHEKPESVSQWIDDETYDCVKKATDQVGMNMLRPIHDALDGQIEYPEIKIAVTHLQTTTKTSRDREGVGFPSEPEA